MLAMSTTIRIPPTMVHMAFFFHLTLYRHLWRTWKIRYHDANLEFTHPHHSFTSSAYHVLEISVTIERKPGFALQTTYPVARLFIILLWFTILFTTLILKC